MIPIWKGRISKGKLELEDRQGLDDYIQTRPNGEYQLILRPKPKEEKTSAAQYRYLKGVVYKVAEQSNMIGYTRDELHEVMKGLFNDGNSTEDMSTKERSEFIDKVRRQLAEMGVNTPDVSEVYF